MKQYNRFGNMMPPTEYHKRPYLMYRPPFRIAGNLYFVGNEWCCSHLIDTGEGLILLDTPAASGLPGLIHNITELGFRMGDLKYIIISHAHADHYGSVNALVHMTGAKTFMSRVDTEDMKTHWQRLEKMGNQLGPYNECFVPNVELEDGDIVALGNTSIRCVLTPGHTVGVMSHFWQLTDEEDRILNVGIYGGAGFVSVSREALERDGLPLSLQQTFLESIDKVWEEKVDIMLGNHPFHNDTYPKYERMCAGEKDAFIDPTEWQRYLQELRERYLRFLKKTPEEIREDYRISQWADYYPLHGSLNTCKPRS